MSQALHMIELRLRAAELIRFAQERGLNQARDEDLGYAAHAWLATVFGALAPKPFRLLDPVGLGRDRAGGLRLLSYTSHSPAALQEHAASFADPRTLGVCDLADLARAKAMPGLWRSGRRLGFEVLACPVTRQEDREKDAFLRKIEHGGAEAKALERAAVYAGWLSQQLGAAARLESAHLSGFRLVKMLRRTQRTETAVRRAVSRITRPQALIAGVLEVRDGPAFGACLARGLGRHRSFGYGMLLLRPVG